PRSGNPRHLHSFPTRRSSDLAVPALQESHVPAAEDLCEIGAQPMSCLAVERLTLRFGGLTAVDGVSFEVRRGEVFTLIGPNGAGDRKSTRLNSSHDQNSYAVF